MSQTFRIVPARAATIWTLGVIVAFLLILAAALLFLSAGHRPSWMFLGLPIIAAAVLFGYIAHSTRHVSFDLSPSGLRIRGDMYGRFIPVASLLPSEAKAIDLRSDGGDELTLRTNGIGLAGYQSGWFRLVNGQKALVFLTERDRAIFLPTRDGYSLLLSPQEPDAFLAALKKMPS
ncbi:MAG TPA: PH domain-containing protein [Candidatus Acidoferrales bacterium]|nr:PH domain-containing protein [Candidatus Acidoferrales bacterium]